MNNTQVTRTLKPRALHTPAMRTIIQCNPDTAGIPNWLVTIAQSGEGASQYEHGNSSYNGRGRE